jgi:dTDP-4-amino-4,6-dideoxygalactose transaminase
MTTNEKVPFLDLIRPHVELEEELVSVFRQSLRTASFIGGPMVEHFEQDFAAFCRTKFCIGVGSGTDAVRFALIAAGVHPGESVITVPNTFIATAEAISQTGAVPEFVDVDERTYNMDPEKLRQYLEDNCETDQRTGKPVSRRTGRVISAVVPVHLYGQPADMDPILDLAEAHNLIVIEDACQAHGAEYFSRKEQCWKKTGSMGKAAAFSFYPGKNLGACGEAGAVTTNDVGIAHTIRMVRDHGQAKKYYHEVVGYNGRLDAIQAGLLHVKLAKLEHWNDQRRTKARLYSELIAATNADLVLPFEPAYSNGTYHLYVIRVPNREQFQVQMAAAKIDTAIHYPVPLHLQKAYAHLGYRTGDLPTTEKIAPEIVSLPMFPHITEEQIKLVVNAAADAVSRTSPVVPAVEHLTSR